MKNKTINTVIGLSIFAVVIVAMYYIGSVITSFPCSQTETPNIIVGLVAILLLAAIVVSAYFTGKSITKR